MLLEKNSQLAKSVVDTIEPLSGPLDPGIADLVEAMRNAGFNTISSCEGHFKAASLDTAKPNVAFNALDRTTLHCWVRLLSITQAPESALPVSIYMFPVWSPERQVVHEDSWALEIDVALCISPKEAYERRDITVQHLIATLDAAIRCRPLATDTFVRSRW